MISVILSWLVWLKRWCFRFRQVKEGSHRGYQYVIMVDGKKRHGESPLVSRSIQRLLVTRLQRDGPFTTFKAFSGGRVSPQRRCWRRRQRKNWGLFSEIPRRCLTLYHLVMASLLVFVGVLPRSWRTGCVCSVFFFLNTPTALKKFRSVFSVPVISTARTDEKHTLRTMSAFYKVALGKPTASAQSVNDTRFIIHGKKEVGE